MKTIKTRDKVKDIKILDKSINLSTRMKKAYVRTKKMAVEIQNPQQDTPANYASENAQDTAQSTVKQTIRSLKSSPQKVRKNIQYAKSHFQEFKSQLPNERRSAAKQAKKTAQTALSNAERLRKSANQTKEAARESKEAVREWKQMLKELRQSNRQAMKDVKQNIKFEQRAKIANTPTSDVKNTIKSNTTVQNTDKIANHSKRVNQSKSSIPNIKALSVKTTKPLNATVKSASNNSISRTITALRTSAKSTGKTAEFTSVGFKATSKSTIKAVGKSAKATERTALHTVKVAVQNAKVAQKTAHTSSRAAKMAEKTAHTAAKTAVRATKSAAKAAPAMAKAAIAAFRSLIAIVAAGGWIAVIIILIICMIAMLVNSVFGVFLSGEPSPTTGMTVNSVITQIDTEYTNEVDSIINANPHDTLNISGARAAWKNVLAVYTVKMSTDQNNPMDTAIMDDEKADILRNVFWDMNTISHWVETVSHISFYTDGNGRIRIGISYEYILHITVTHKIPDEMAEYYGFDNKQKKWLGELLKPEYNSLWNGLLYGISSLGDGSLVEVAATQIGNIDGEIYWSWYGFSNRVAWCACFVSWVAEQCGYIEAGIVPRFSLCDDGIQWFKDRGQWQDNSYTPAPGDIIFFDWNGDGISDHVGIVEFVEGDTVHTIEGNTNDSCARRSYRSHSADIMGYGVPRY